MWHKERCSFKSYILFCQINVYSYLCTRNIKSSVALHQPSRDATVV